MAKARATGLHDPLDLQNAISTLFPAVTHVDFSARLLTIDTDFGSRAYDVLKAFHAKTGCPVLLNTSFNVRGEPIVCSPEDAVTCFLNTHLDLLVIGPCLVRKSEQATSVKTKVGRIKFAAD
ncbi:MAG: carbamoyltransferase C-terminal domain-containing protein [Pseudomonadota bacterium]